MSKPFGFRTAIGLGAALFFAAVPVDASIYKWVDAQGNTHYSQAAPTDQKAREVVAPPTQPAAEAGRRQPDKVMQELETIQRNQGPRGAEHEAQQKESRQREAEIRQARCAEIRYNLAVLRRPAPVFTVSESGEREYLEDEERAAEISRLTEAEASICGDR
jgi:hypothetical protein